MTTYESFEVGLNPTYLTGPWGQRWRRAFGRAKDALEDLTRQAVKARHIALMPDDALDPAGQDRGIERYPADTNESYRARLSVPWTTWQGAGTRPGIVGQLNAYGITGVTLENQGRDGWASDNDTYNYSRFWVLFTAGGHPWSALTVGSGLIVGEETVVGSTMTLTQYKSLRHIVHKWRDGAGLGVEFIVIYSGIIASPQLVAGNTTIAGASIARLPIGRFFGYGFGQVAGDSCVCGYYFDEVR